MILWKTNFILLYKEKFKYPERIAKVNGEIVAVPFKPKTKEAERWSQRETGQPGESALS